MCTMNQIKASVKISEPFLNCVTDLDLTVSDSMSLEIFVEFEHFVLCVFSFICFLEKSIFKDLHHYRVLCLFEVSVFMFALLLREVSQYIYEKPRYQMFLHAGKPDLLNKRGLYFCFFSQWGHPRCLADMTQGFNFQAALGCSQA